MAGSVSLPFWLFPCRTWRAAGAPWLAVSELVLRSFSSTTWSDASCCSELRRARCASHCLRSPIALGNEAGDTNHCGPVGPGTFTASSIAVSQYRMIWRWERGTPAATSSAPTSWTEQGVTQLAIVELWRAMARRVLHSRSVSDAATGSALSPSLSHDLRCTPRVSLEELE